MSLKRVTIDSSLLYIDKLVKEYDIGRTKYLFDIIEKSNINELIKLKYSIKPRLIEYLITNILKEYNKIIHIEQKDNFELELSSKETLIKDNFIIKSTKWNDENKNDSNCIITAINISSILNNNKIENIELKFIQFNELYNIIDCFKIITNINTKINDIINKFAMEFTL